MRQLPSGENVKLTLVVIASVSTVALFTYLALHQPERSPGSSLSPPKVVEPALELRHEVAEAPRPPQPGMSAETPQSAPQTKEQEDASDRTVDTDNAVAASTISPESPAEKERRDTPRLGRKLDKPDIVSKTALEKHASKRGAVRSGASFRTLPNKKCEEHEPRDSDVSPPDPLSEFFSAF